MLPVWGGQVRTVFVRLLSRLLSIQQCGDLISEYGPYPVLSWSGRLDSAHRFLTPLASQSQSDRYRRLDRPVHCGGLAPYLFNAETGKCRVFTICTL